MTLHDLRAYPSDLEVIARHAAEAGTMPPRVAIVAGSGLGGLADRVVSPVRVPYCELPCFPHLGAVAGHAGELVLGTLADVSVVVFSGRIHGYQGATALESAYTARLAAGLGCEVIIVTNAAGGVGLHLSPGQLVLLSDQVNMTGDNPLVGWPGPVGGVPFVPMRDAFDPALRALTIAAALELDVTIEPEGVYFGLLGPAYETVAEVEMLRTLGADLVGMSTVHEVIAARALGLRVLGISLVTNVAAGHDLNHEEVLAAGERAAGDMERLVTGILARLS